MTLEATFAAFDVPVLDKLAARTVTHTFGVDGGVDGGAGGGVTREVALPITFTPFASARPCSARCTFCSETLVHDEARVLSASLRPSATYARELAACMRVLEGLPVGFSLSGLEATDDAEWLGAVLDVLDAHGRVSPVDERVLYSNGNGLHPETHGPTLVPRLARFGLTRVELSRHAVDQRANDEIMRFRDDARVAVRERSAFEDTLRFVRAGGLHVRLVCVVQRAGVADLDGALAYLDWARALGVDDVVFRELSRTGASYKPNGPLRLVDDGRVPIDAFVKALVSSSSSSSISSDSSDSSGSSGSSGAVTPIERTRGYYYENVRVSWDGMSVTFETSDYVDMKTRHRSGVVHKLVFHANGNLCADWDPEREVLWRASHDAR